jgi:membrane associated rhomboid family serine protease
MRFLNADALALTAAARTEVWRLWTGHLVHYDLAHLVTDAMAVAVPLALVDRARRCAILLALPLIAPAVSLALLAAGGFDEYRGASALAMAIWIIASLSLLESKGRTDRACGSALLILIITKLAAETAGLGHVWHGIPPSPLAHACGAVAGLGTLGVWRITRLIRESIPISIERW